MEKRKALVYIRPKAAWKKLVTAQAMSQTVYMYAVTGYGKTELIHNYFKSREYEYYTCKNGRIQQVEMKDRKNKKRTKVTDEDEVVLSAIVVDDLQFLRETQDKEKILSWIRNEEYWVILISRSTIPAWLKSVYMSEGILQIQENDLMLRKKEVVSYWEKNNGEELSAETLEEIGQYCRGNPLALRLVCKMAEENGKYEPRLLEKCWHDFEDYLIERLMKEWDVKLIAFLMHMSFMEKITVPLAEMVTGNSDAYQLLQQALEVGNFMEQKEDGGYEIRPMLQAALQKKAKNTYSRDVIRELYYNAGLYYEMKDDVARALDMYQRSDNPNRIREILIRNAKRNPGNGHYFELRDYYFSLPEDSMEKDSVLLCGMSMLYSLLLQPEESERWYEKLKALEAGLSGAAQKEAKSQITYLDIALPHRGITGVLDIIKAVPGMLFERGIQLPEFSVTSNLPSVMNGGKDFCEWSKRDRALASSIGKVLSSVLGRYGKGLIDIALGESLYEKGTQDYEVIALLNKGSLRAECGGTVEMEYAAIGVQVRLNLFHGNEEAARELLEGFSQKAEQGNILGLKKNIEAQKCRIALYEGDVNVVEEWMDQAPKEEKEFYILERYRYLTKIRCYIFMRDYFRALALLEKMRFYAEFYKRTYIQIETNLFLAIVQYRTGQEGWKETLYTAVRQAEEYGFYRVISEEGQAAWDLFQKPVVQKELRDMCDETYIERLFQETHAMAVYYPRYLTANSVEVNDFHGNALEILRFQAEGYTNGQIAVQLGIKEETVRYHISQNYKKLGVENKAEAVLAARNLRIL